MSAPLARADIEAAIARKRHYRPCSYCGCTRIDPVTPAALDMMPECRRCERAVCEDCGGCDIHGVTCPDCLLVCVHGTNVSVDSCQGCEDEIEKAQRERDFWAAKAEDY